MHGLATIKMMNASAAQRHSEGTTYTPVYEGNLPKPPFVREAFQILWQLVNDRESWTNGKISFADYELALRHNINDATKMFKEMGN